MSNEQIKTLIEQEAERYFTIHSDPEDARKDYIKHGATFYEQSILPEVLKEKDEEFRYMKNCIIPLHESNLEKRVKQVEDLESQLSQLQSKMETKDLELSEMGQYIRELNDKIKVYERS